LFSNGTHVRGVSIYAVDDQHDRFFLDGKAPSGRPGKVEA
jgi:hypothetical protein